MDTNKFSTLSTEEKIEELINNAKDTIINGGRLLTTFYLFDRNEKLHVIPIENKFLLRDNKTKILKKVIKREFYY